MTTDDSSWNSILKKVTDQSKANYLGLDRIQLTIEGAQAATALLASLTMTLYLVGWAMTP